MHWLPVKIKSSEVVLLVSFYLFMMINYFLVLAIDTGIIRVYRVVMLDYLFKALLSLPIWWLFFRYLVNRPLWVKVITHLAALPTFCFLWTVVYYAVCDYFGFIHLQGVKIAWDLYHTALFYVVQFIGFHLYDYYTKHKQQELFALELRELALQSELTALKAQLNPHFLYNVFNTINAAIPTQAEKTRNMVAKLSDLFRYQLKASKEELVTLKEELDFVTKYLDLEKERFGERLQYHLEISDDTLQHTIPPILIQPLVENSIKHGISPLIDGGKITLSIRTTADQLTVSVTDTGVGLQNGSEESALKKGVGLSNTHERLMKMYNSGLQLIHKKPSGLEVRFSIPIMK